MARKVSTGGQITRYIRGAFNKAESGEIEEALRLWDKAIKLGWQPNPHTEKGLVIAIERARRDLGLDKAKE